MGKVLIGIGVVVTVGLVGFAAYYVWKRSRANASAAPAMLPTPASVANRSASVRATVTGPQASYFGRTGGLTRGPLSDIAVRNAVTDTRGFGGELHIPPGTVRG